MVLKTWSADFATSAMRFLKRKGSSTPLNDWIILLEKRAGWFRPGRRNRGAEETYISASRRAFEPSAWTRTRKGIRIRGLVNMACLTADSEAHSTVAETLVNDPRSPWSLSVGFRNTAIAGVVCGFDCKASLNSIARHAAWHLKSPFSRKAAETHHPSRVLRRSGGWP